ncbi:MAG: hypothetical protein A2821_01720 [Candidatus Magasanikbacteria bacterium RIFCSPHIGHO2_01_FULL_41_23]|uniref:VTT domain-containing protein n=1 Tax=Candidatus Magasanikbacteria bacterium RIFCSPLOWO2_01_FULL_40_15 TaxID=1798686 RepID=A0A1F6N2R6_9BACT|nr:MAG: hypothetical protein A2821_01720 [Candidatus Magasanikbacteria bacterium RIFCSPHIGHO2_01_FULL_41_23]OGH75042.1 MAG: hypothetical protein A3F22_00430 [Candidatus Magasanikbacteria bacterium RIFCSPHIGHO2_12_FULL_41_16]OGH78296.1 MAG: hypothetical protein A2983_04035 [Candidatus Magasanikbacteria bacterium RIFCSPLOWO2_01_FULL_40_15]
MLASLSIFITNFIERVGYLGLGILMALEAIIAPIPSELIVPFAGFLISDGRFSWFGVLVATTIGSLIGAYALYALGRYGGRPLIARWGHWVLVKPEDIVKAEKFFVNHGRKAIFLSKFVPIVRSYVALPAGLSRMPLAPFFFYSALGSIIWNTFLIYLGFTLKNNWERAAGIISYGDKIGTVLFVLVIIIWIVRHHTKKRHDTASVV